MPRTVSGYSPPTATYAFSWHAYCILSVKEGNSRFAIIPLREPLNTIIGQRTIHVRKSTNDTKRITCAVSVTASGKFLPPLLVFKGSRNGRIAKRKFPTFTDRMQYACQENAWMDEVVMLHWVENILKPYVALAPTNIIPILFLDSYRCHMMASVVEAIQKPGVEVDHIPAGCTYLCQPVDVGINKPLKSRIRQSWERWMLAEGIIHGTTSPPRRADIVNWTNWRNAWRHGQYTWFLQTCEPNNLETIASDDDEDNLILSVRRLSIEYKHYRFTVVNF